MGSRRYGLLVGFYLRPIIQPSDSIINLFLVHIILLPQVIHQQKKHIFCGQIKLVMIGQNFNEFKYNFVQELCL